MDVLVRAVTEGKMKDTSLGTTQQDFALGRLGLWVHPTSRTGQIIRQSQGKFEVRSVPFPLNAGDKSRIPAGGSGMLMMTKDPAKQKAAWEYMKFASGPIGTSIMVKATGYIPGNSIPGNDPKLLKDFFDSNHNLKVSLGQLPVLTGWYAFPGENGLKITDVIKDDLQSVVNLSVKPDVALKKMTDDVQALLPK
jgi:multiple sugar transport system substrate-binding protein